MSNTTPEAGAQEQEPSRAQGEGRAEEKGEGEEIRVLYQNVRRLGGAIPLGKPPTPVASRLRSNS